MSAELGLKFEAEIRQQPALWRTLAASPIAAHVAAAVGNGPVCLIGSGSSLFVAELGALALRRRGIRAHALPATEALFDAAVYRGALAIALSQSGRSPDVLRALELLEPSRTIALTNVARSPLAQRADLTFDIQAGPETAVPATKSVSLMAATLLWAAALCGTRGTRDASALVAVADATDRWLDDTTAVRAAARVLATCRSAAVLGAGYGRPVAAEIALKLKEAAYVHAEGFAAGEFRHGSTAILDRATPLIGIVDSASRDIVGRPLREAARAGAPLLSIGAQVEGATSLGPAVEEPFNTLAWLVAGQTLALYVGRERGIDSDAPRGLTKVVF